MNDVCLRQMMLATPMMTASPNDVCLTAHWGKHRIIATNGSNIIFAKQMHHIAEGDASLIRFHAYGVIWCETVEMFADLWYNEAKKGGELMITNDNFSKEEKRLLDFILKQDFESKAETINYINTLATEHIVRDYSPYYKIIEFRTPNIQDGYSGMSNMIMIQTVRQDGSTPTVFTLYAKDGFPFEYEIYNADSSVMDMNTILDGELIVG